MHRYFQLLTGLFLSILIRGLMRGCKLQAKSMFFSLSDSFNLDFPRSLYMLRSFFRVSFFFLNRNIYLFIEAGCVLELPWCFKKAVQFVFICSCFMHSCEFLHSVICAMFSCCLQYICLMVIFLPS